jgi:hypothetical protein
MVSEIAYNKAGVDALVAGKLTYPTGGADGQVLAKSGSGAVWTPITATPVTGGGSGTTNSQLGTSYVLVFGDANNKVEMTNANANTVTIPPNTSVAFPIGTEIMIRQYGVGQTTIAAGTGVTIRYVGGNAINTQYGAVLVEKRGTDEWILSGNTAASDTVPPTVPTDVVATPGNGQILLSWSASTDAVGIAGYRIRRSGGIVATTTGTTFTDVNLTNGATYTYAISAYDNAGNESAQSTTVSASPSASAAVPAAPTGLTATAGSGQVTLTWSAPGSNGGSAITDYLVQYQAAGGSFTTFSDGVSTATNRTVTGLTGGTVYTFRVAAINAVGTGPVSATATATPTASFLPFTETFTLPDGSAWASPPWSSGSGTAGGSATVQNGSGYLNTSGTAGSSWRKTLSGMSYSTTDIDFTTTLQFAAAANAAVFRVYVSTNLSSGAASENGYFCDMNFTTTNTVDIAWSRVTNGTVASLGTANGNALGIAPTGLHKIHVQRTGTTLRTRVWNAANAEPSTWLSSVVDPNTPQPSGVIAVMTFQTAAAVTNAILNDLSVF